MRRKLSLFLVVTMLLSLMVPISYADEKVLKTGDVTIVALNEDGEPLEGVSFTLGTGEDAVKTEVTNADGKVVIPLGAGKHLVKEDVIPEGYANSEEPVEINVEETFTGYTLSLIWGNYGFKTDDGKFVDTVSGQIAFTQNGMPVDGAEIKVTAGDSEPVTVKSEDGFKVEAVGTYKAEVTFEDHTYTVEGTVEGGKSVTGEKMYTTEESEVKPQTFEVVLKKEAVSTVLFTCVDEDGEVLIPEQKMDKNVGDDYAVEHPEIEGYTFKGISSSSAPDTGKATQGTINVVLVYTKNTVRLGTISMICIDSETGKPIRDMEPVVGNVPAGTEYNAEAPVIEGYTFRGVTEDSIPLSGIVENGVRTIVLVYEKNDGLGNVIVECRNIATGELLQDAHVVVKDGKVGDKYETTAPTVEGYTYKAISTISAPVSGEIKELDQRVIYLYEKTDKDVADNKDVDPTKPSTGKTDAASTDAKTDTKTSTGAKTSTAKGNATGVPKTGDVAIVGLLMSMAGLSTAEILAIRKRRKIK